MLRRKILGKCEPYHRHRPPGRHEIHRPCRLQIQEALHRLHRKSQDRREGDGCEGVRTPSLSLFCDQLVAGAADVDDADVWVFGEGTAQAGDEDLEAAGVEEVVIAPEGQEDVLGGDDAAAAFA